MDQTSYSAEDMALRPYEKCEKFGAEALSDAELIAVIIKTGCAGMNAVELSEKLLSYTPQDETDHKNAEDHTLREGYVKKHGLSGLLRLSSDELKSFKGIGRVKSLQLLCLKELSKRLSMSEAMNRLDFSDPLSVAAYYMPLLSAKAEEEVHVMLLDTRNGFICSRLVSKGTINASVISPREIFLTALKFNAAGIIMVHNHPSGDPAPSMEDIKLSNEIKKLGLMMNVQLLDSIIIGNNIYISFVEKGLFN